MNTYLIRALLIISLMLPTYIKGQEYGVITIYCPDQTESSTLIPKGLFQVETGTFYVKNENQYWNCGLTYLLKNHIQFTTSRETVVNNKQSLYVSRDIIDYLNDKMI